MRRAKHNLGFTLVELLVVISIIVALASIVWQANAAIATRNKLQTQERAFDVLGDAVMVYLEVASNLPPQPNTLDQVMTGLGQGKNYPQALLRDQIALASTYLYRELSSVAESRRLLSRMPTGCVSGLNSTVDQGGGNTPEIRDVWGTPLFYQSTTSFPLFISAGPDLRFDTSDTSDDIRSQ